MMGKWICFCWLMIAQNLAAQQIKSFLKDFPSLPHITGLAGMFAGVVKGRLVCMGGTNFPGEMPWEKGEKKWSDQIFIFNGKQWRTIKEKLPLKLAYGISVSYKNGMIIAGGNNADSFSKKVFHITYNDEHLQFDRLPDLPIPLASAGGTTVGQLLIIAGGDTAINSVPLKKTLILDLEKTEKGWIEIESWPGPERRFSVCSSFNGMFFLFSGETVWKTGIASGKRKILNDAYCLFIQPDNEKYKYTWKQLSPLPKGIAAAPQPVPYIKGTGFVFWGGVDEVTALYVDNATHVGINNYIISYDPEKDEWHTLGRTYDHAARVTAPVVFYNKTWMYISGEIKPGIRTNSIVGLK